MLLLFFAVCHAMADPPIRIPVRWCILKGDGPSSLDPGLVGESNMKGVLWRRHEFGLLLVALCRTAENRLALCRTGSLRSAGRSVRRCPAPDLGIRPSTETRRLVVFLRSGRGVEISTTRSFSIFSLAPRRKSW